VFLVIFIIKTSEFYTTNFASTSILNFNMIAIAKISFILPPGTNNKSVAP
jgi:hypothetical protein